MSRISLLLALPALLAATACTYGDHNGRYDHDPSDGSNSCGSPAERGVIDTDGTLEVEPAAGVGVFVEYGAGGHWRIYVSCDTDQSGYDCEFDVIAKPLEGGTVLSVTSENLESNDSVSIIGDDSVNLISRTDYDFDGFKLDTQPGVALSVDAFLDNACTNYVYWVENGAVHDGAPTSPIELQPSAE